MKTKKQTSLTVNLGERSYPIIIGDNNLNKLGAYLQELNLGSDVFLITDDIVGKLYADKLVKSLRKEGLDQIHIATIPGGEKSKTLANWEKLLTELTAFDNGLNKRIVVVNLGGGVVGDLGGFVAATYRRGINYVQVPTTLLANVDSGVGGKVGVNFKEGKNLVGSFYQPSLVFVDLALMRTLPTREIRAGLAEVIKYGVIADEELFSFLEENYPHILTYDLDATRHVVQRSYEIKAWIVEADERDVKGIRAKLNFGHTFAHAVEAASGYAHFRHGEAVAVGMVCAAELANHLGMFPRKDTQRLEMLLNGIGLPTRIHSCNISDIMKALAHDKKFVNKKNRLVLPTALGEVVIEEGVDEVLLREVIAHRLD